MQRGMLFFHTCICLILVSYSGKYFLIEIVIETKADEVLKKFAIVRKELRALANMPREHFQGFVGNLPLELDIANEAQKLSIPKRVFQALGKVFSRNK